MFEIKTIANINAIAPASKTLTCLKRITARTIDTMINISAVILPVTSAFVTGPGENNSLNFFTIVKI